MSEGLGIMKAKFRLLSLGTEIATPLGFFVDNLFVDGTGCLVVAELSGENFPSIKKSKTRAGLGSTYFPSIKG